MADTRWRTQELDEDAIGALDALFARVWPRPGGHAETIRWAFGRPPRGRGLVLAAIMPDGTAIGARGSIPWPLDDAGSVIHQFHGTCVDPDHRRVGIFSALNRAFLDEFARRGGQAVFNISVAESRAGYEKLGWRYLPGLRRYLLPASPLRIALAVARHGYQALRGGLPARMASSTAPPSFDEVRGFLDARTAAVEGRLTSRYDAAWYAWRFSQRQPGYRFLVRPQGALVYYVQRRGDLTDVFLGDVWPRRYRLADVARLVLALLRAERPALVSILLSHGHPLRPLVTRLGFLPDPKGDLNHGVRVVDPRAERLLDPDRWALASADIDTF